MTTETSTINWLLIGVTAAMTLFILFVRGTEFYSHRKLLKELTEKGEKPTVSYKNYNSLYAYSIMAVVVFVASLFMGGDLFERIVMSIIFVVLIGSEVLSAYVHAHLYTTSKEYIYGATLDRYRSIKGYEAKGKRSTYILKLNKEKSLVPNEVAEALKTTIEAHKKSKKA